MKKTIQFLRWLFVPTFYFFNLGGGNTSSSSTTNNNNQQDRKLKLDGAQIGAGAVAGISGDSNTINVSDHNAVNQSFAFATQALTQGIEATTEAGQDATERLSDALLQSNQARKETAKAINNAHKTADKTSQNNKVLMYAIGGLIAVVALMAIRK